MPFTPNSGFSIPNTGDLPGTWGEDAVNPDFVAVDGMLSGAVTLSLSSAGVTLTKPAGFTATPGAGPTQSQNRVLRLTGTLLNSLTVELPIPGSYIVDNRTTGNFFVNFRGDGGGGGEVFAVPQGEVIELYNDGTNVRPVGLERVGTMQMWGGISAMPSWISGCTKAPYLMCDGSILNVATYPYLAAILGSKFGGNGITTFGLPDLRGRVPLAYDGGTSRITTAGSGINGLVVGSSGGAQNVTLVTANIPSITSQNASQAISVATASGVKLPGLDSSNNWIGSLTNVTLGGSTFVPFASSSGNVNTVTTMSGTNNIVVAYVNVSPTAVRTVPPAQVTGIWVIKT